MLTTKKQERKTMENIKTMIRKIKHKISWSMIGMGFKMMPPQRIGLIEPQRWEIYLPLINFEPIYGDSQKGDYYRYPEHKQTPVVFFNTKKEAQKLASKLRRRKTGPFSNLPASVICLKGTEGWVTK